MQKIKFNKDDIIASADLVAIGNRLKCSFSDEDIIDYFENGEFGFVELNEHNDFVQADYSEYNYVYQKIDEFTVILTTDPDDIYVEPEITEDAVDFSAVELSEAQKRVFQINIEIDNLRKMIADSDYKIIKAYEYSMVGIEEPPYDIVKLHEDRQALRDRINELEEELISINKDNENNEEE